MRRRPRKGATQPSLWPSSPRRGREPTQRRPAVGDGRRRRRSSCRAEAAVGALAARAAEPAGQRYVGRAARRGSRRGRRQCAGYRITIGVHAKRAPVSGIETGQAAAGTATVRTSPPRTSIATIATISPSLLFCVQRARCSRLFCSRLFCARARRRNLVCVCNAVCPDETSAWASCFRAVAKKQREGKDTSELGNCEEARRQLDVCTQHASTRLLHAAVLPSDRSDVL